MLTRLVLLAALFAVPLMSTDEPKVRRLESLAWNPLASKLTWTVSNGMKNDKGEFVAEKEQQQTFVIDLADATMEYKGTKRRFAQEEAENVAVVMGLISKYAQESTMWWESGKGAPVGGPSQKVELMPAHPRANWPVQGQLAANTTR